MEDGVNKMKNIRQRALFVIDHVFYKGAFLEEELEILKSSKLEERDYQFIRELATGVVRHRSYLDYIIAKNSNVKFKKIHPLILSILEMGLYQCYFMDRVPDHAIVSQSVELAKTYGNRGSVSFVNGILRNLVKKEMPKVVSKDPVERLSLQYSHPKWYVEYFYRQKGLLFTEELLWANNQPYSLSFRINTLCSSKKILQEKLENRGYQWREGNLEESFFIDNPSHIFETKEFLEGEFYAQDEASMMVAKILAPQKGEFILDLCAAPGGKTTHMAALMDNEGEIIACDKSKHKLNFMEENCRRLHVTNVKGMVNDAIKKNRNFIDSFDAVLVDAPCSAVGLYRKKPDIKWNRSRKDIESLAQIQLKILSNAAQYVKKGGRLVYSTCSVTPWENEEVLQKFMEQNEEFYFEKVEGENVRYYFPHQDHTDGFAVAVAKKKES